MNISQLLYYKQQKGYSLDKLSELSGVPKGTIQKIFSGETKSPRYETLKALEKVLKPDTVTYDFEPAGASQVEEASVAYGKKQGEYTLEDYYALPDERRVELIDGVIYDMAAPTSIHQIIAGHFYAQLLSYVMSKKGKCMPMISPLDVQLDCDNKTMVQPDVVVVCDRDKIIKRCVYGAPDLVVEVLSPYTKKKDMTLKMHKYANAGVKEYWLIDPDKKKIIVYNFIKDDYSIYGFDSIIPVAIWDGDCQIDFNVILEAIQFLYEK